MAKEQEPVKGRDKDEILEEAKERFKASLEYYREEYARGLEDADFALGNQWPENIKSQRERDARPCLTENRLMPFVHQVVNDIRQARPAIRVAPVDSKADPETAEILSGMVRNIETLSDAETAYDTAAQNAVMTGYGYIRVLTQYTEETTNPQKAFEKELMIERVLNPFSVFLDPSHKRMDGSDAEYGFIFDDIDEDEFEDLYPDADKEGFETDDMGVWMDDDTIRVVEYYYKDYEEHTVTDGVNTRTVRIPVVKWCKLTGCEILEETVTEHKYIPIVPVYGDEFWHDGKRVSYSLIHQAKDPQRMFNYWKSASTEIIALQPKAPYVGPEGSFANNPDMWATANTQNHAFLEYRPVEYKGSLLPRPERQHAPMGSSAMIQESMMAADGIRATLGVFGASLGDKGPEASGVAIAQRQREGDNATFHFSDNLATALRHVGKILVDAIPKIYSGQRIARIIGVDGEPKNVPLGVPYTKQGKEYQQAQSVEVAQGIFDLEVGKYDVVVDVGPSYATKRQELTASIADIAKAYPRIMEVAGDLFIQNLDFPMAKEIGERIRATMPPELLSDNPQAEMLKEASQMVQSLQQQLMQMDAALKAKQDNTQADNAIKVAEIELKKQELEIKAAETQAKIMQMNVQTAQALPPEVIAEIADNVAALGEAVQELDSRMTDTGGAVNEILENEAKKQAKPEPVGFIDRIFGRNRQGKTND